VGERYGRWQNDECKGLKLLLLELEDSSPGGAGRVRLSHFYHALLHDGQGQYQESVSYLRALGALDESDSEVPRVIIPNYILAPSNCMASSNFYSVCCLDECEHLLGHLENEIGSPDASPDQVAALVAALPSPTTLAKRNLSTVLLSRLEEVAEHHGGRVQLHGRLFAQWMHLAYPRECSYPHVSGTTNPLMQSEFVTATGFNWAVSLQEAQQYDEQYTPGTVYSHARPRGDENSDVTCGMWTMEEDLTVERSLSAIPEQAPVWRTVGGRAGLLGMAISMAVGLFRMRAESLLPRGPEHGIHHKLYV